MFSHNNTLRKPYLNSTGRNNMNWNSKTVDLLLEPYTKSWTEGTKLLRIEKSDIYRGVFETLLFTIHMH